MIYYEKHLFERAQQPEDQDRVISTSRQKFPYW